MTIKIKRRERDSVLQALQAGLVPKQGLHHIPVGRKAEVTTLLGDIERLLEGGSSFRIAVGRFGSGKSFFLSLIRSVALQQNLVVASADFTMERRLWASGGEARALYTEMMRNLSTKAQPEGGALGSLLNGWISNVKYEVMSKGGDEGAVVARISNDLRSLENHVGGFEFAEVVRHYYLGHENGDDSQQSAALRWLRAEYTTKTEARQVLGVRRIIEDESIYDTLKLMASFCRIAGYGGLLVSLDEMVVLSHRLPNSRSRQANYEALLMILNDCLQGNSGGLGFVFGGTDECLEDKRRGLFSYEALRSRLAENQLAKEQGYLDLSGPVLRLQPLTPEDLFVLLHNIVTVHASGDPNHRLVPDEAIVATLEKANQTLGADFFRTPRDVVRQFIGLLNILDQNPGSTWQEILDKSQFAKPTLPMSDEEALDSGAIHTTDDAEDDLATFRL